MYVYVRGYACCTSACGSQSRHQTSGFFLYCYPVLYLFIGGRVSYWAWLPWQASNLVESICFCCLSLNQCQAVMKHCMGHQAGSNLTKDTSHERNIEVPAGTQTGSAGQISHGCDCVHICEGTCMCLHCLCGARGHLGFYCSVAIHVLLWQDLSLTWPASSLTFLSIPPRCWNCKHVMPYLAFSSLKQVLGLNRSLCFQSKSFTKGDLFPSQDKHFNWHLRYQSTRGVTSPVGGPDHEATDLTRER